MWKKIGMEIETGKPMIVGSGIGYKVNWATRAYFLYDEWRLAINGETLPMQPTHYKELSQ
tara:strand:- start:365 stop:544 length:180 start_codon:yes stop_codon:yes gene_type:complete